MLEHMGCEETDVEFLDYMLRYEALSAAHIEAVRGIALIRAAGRGRRHIRDAVDVGASEEIDWSMLYQAA
jgi:hypothetical protein